MKKYAFYIIFLSVLLYSCQKKNIQKNISEIYYLPKDYHTLIPLSCNEFYFLNKQVYKLQINDQELINDLISEFNDLNKSKFNNEVLNFDVRYRILVNDTLIFCIDDFGKAMINNEYIFELKMFENIKEFIEVNDYQSIKLD